VLAAAHEFDIAKYFDGKKDEFGFSFFFLIKFKILCFHWVSVGRVLLFLNYELK